ncbi:putative 2-oxoglutarate-dependent dioxygenase [Lachnellula occidentalis]|uniref:Putative 2-oxoglutarate-dependent dioxygenase n=1 Tax=Lachnellula occidentalis TaxID=215460 RepID=A0A8H8UCI4_9HELO|nr:putative 2-oxoglutarate-dependent dioxygenase [Lachnellula occidentalis]
MAKPETTIIEAETPGLRAHGIFKKGKAELRSHKPMLVLIHGGGTNASYFDNEIYSSVNTYGTMTSPTDARSRIPATFIEAGFDVLNINRAGYGGNPMPESKQPILDSIPLYSALITKAYDDHANGQNGIVLIGHSLGAVISLSLAAFEGQKLPILGISALGIIPTKDHPAVVVKALEADPENPRLVFEPSPDSVETFMGPLSVLDMDVLTHPSMLSIFEPFVGVKSEMVEWFDPTWYDRFVNDIAPRIRVPLQFLAAAFELGWRGIEEGQPTFDWVAGLFTNAPKMDARILPGGGHNFELSKNAPALQEARESFINTLKLSSSPDSNLPAFNDIPLLDFASTSDPATKPEFLKALRTAIVDVGFLYIKNTTISPSIQENLITKGIEALELPLEEKLKIEMANSKHFLGYARLGAEITAMKSDYREQYDFATEVPAPGPEEPPHRNLRGPNQWPDESVIKGFRTAVESYLEEIATFAISFSRLIAEALDMPANSFERFFENPQHNKLKLVKYPVPPLNTPIPESGIQGVGAHKDGSFLTFLLQATPHAGLEIQNKHGDWIQALPIPGTLVINIGRSLQALTGGVCTATTHRVNLSPQNFLAADGTALGPRYSFPVFQGIRTDLDGADASLKIPQHIRDLVKDEKVRSEAEATFDKMFGNSERVREAVFISRITSHQDVGARWYPELLAKALEAQREFKGKAAVERV